MSLKTALIFIGATIGGWIGWILGTPVSFFFAFILSTIGSGVGMYAGSRLASRWT